MSIRKEHCLLEYNISRTKFMDMMFKRKFKLVGTNRGGGGHVISDVFLRKERVVVAQYFSNILSEVSGLIVKVVSVDKIRLTLTKRSYKKESKYYRIHHTSTEGELKWEYVLTCSSLRRAKNYVNLAPCDKTCLVTETSIRIPYTEKTWIARGGSKELHELDQYSKIPVDEELSGNEMQVEEGIKDYYKILGLTPPNIVWTSNIFEFTSKINEHLNTPHNRDFALTACNALHNFSGFTSYLCNTRTKRSILLSKLDARIIRGIYVSVTILNDLRICVKAYRRMVEDKLFDPNVYYYALSEAILKICSWADALYFSPIENTVFLMRPIKEITMDIPEIQNHLRLHNDCGPICVFSDNTALYALEDVVVPEYIVKLAPDEIPIERVLKEENAEVRMIGIKKIGLQRLLNNKTVFFKEIEIATTKVGGQYRLLDLYLPGEVSNMEYKPYRPYLEMTNPSTGEKHYEGVSPNCRTVEDALGWRNFGYAPEILT